MISTFRSLIAIAGALCAFGVAPLAAQWSGHVAVDSRVFPQSPLAEKQHGSDLSLVFRPELYLDWARGRQSLLFEPFLRLDWCDGRRTHADIRALAWQMAWQNWELRAGIRKVFWGVTESQHLVDIINQTDLVENIDGEDKLGQPMVNLAVIRSWGTVDLFVLPWFRERTFPGREGRLRFPLTVDTRNATFESSAGRRHIDWAVRWSHTIGNWDVGLTHFSGTSRDPRLMSGVDDEGNQALIPHYDLINQTGVDLQWTTGGWLWKLESIVRSRQGELFGALTGGFEYTFPGVFGSNADLGLLAEYLFDTRGEGATTPLQDDLFVGARMALNDAQSTSVLVGAVVDRATGSSLLSVEGQRRIGDGWTLAVEVRGFVGVALADPLHGLRRDDHLAVRIARYF